MLDLKSESVVLPLVARIVQTIDAAVNATKSEGADFLIYDNDDPKDLSQEVNSVCEKVKIPIFVSWNLQGARKSILVLDHLCCCVIFYLFFRLVFLQYRTMLCVLILASFALL
ncbi:hypothetical protein HN51_046749 [Arachis hypogaea]